MCDYHVILWMDEYGRIEIIAEQAIDVDQAVLLRARNKGLPTSGMLWLSVREGTEVQTLWCPWKDVLKIRWRE